MKHNLRLVLDTQRLNFHLTQWPETVLDPFEDLAVLVEAFHTQKAAIDEDRRLTAEGKRAARQKAHDTTLEAIEKWHAPRLAGLDADIGQHRAALLPTGKPPDQRRVDFMLGLLRKHTPDDIAVFYGSATDEERRVIEAAAASVGRMPVKTANGLEWKPLLNPETVNESILARATTANPQGAKKLAELTEIRQMHVTVAGVAAAEVREALG